MIKMIFFDIDGTTYQNNIHDSPASTKIAFKKLKDLGIKLAICTSRTYYELTELPAHFYEYMDAMVCGGGAEIYKEGEQVSSHIINEEDVKKIMSVFATYDIDYRWTSNKKENYLNCDKQELKERFSKIYNMAPDAKTYTDENLIHILYFSRDRLIKDKVKACCENSAHLEIGIANEVTAKSITKAHGMFECAKMFGFDENEVAAFGDGHNDVDMIEKAEIGIAMGNAVDALKLKATYVTENIEDDGLYKACEHFNWFTKDGE